MKGGELIIGWTICGLSSHGRISLSAQARCNFCEGSSVGIFVVGEMLIGGATVGSFCEFTKKLYLCRAFWNEIGRTK